MTTEEEIVDSKDSSIPTRASSQKPPKMSTADTLKQPTPFVDQWRRKCIYLPVLLATAIWLYFVPHVGIMPDNDYWGLIGQLLGSDGFHLTIHGLYSQGNEHIIALPKLIYFANVLLTGGDNRALASIVCLFSLAIGLLLASTLRDTLRPHASHASWGLLLAFGCVAGLAAFTPLAMHNFFYGMSGIAWIGTNLLTLSALYLQYRYPASYKALAMAVILALLAAQSYSSGMPALLLLGIQMILQRNTRLRGVIIMAAGVCLLVAAYLHQTVPISHGHRVFSPYPDGEFVAIFIGAGLTSYPDLAGIWGALGILVFSSLAIHAFWRQQSLSPLQAFWVTVGGYVISSALMAAIGRVDVFGPAGAVASRYATLPALFWVAVVGLSLEARPPRSQLRASDRTAPTSTALIAGVAVLTIVVGSHQRLHQYLTRALHKPIAALSIYLGVNDTQLIRTAVTPAPVQLTSIRTQLLRTGHVPFNGHFNQCPQPGKSIAPIGQKGTATPKGFVDSGQWLGTGPFVKLRGWAANSDGSPYHELIGKPHCIAIVDAAGVVRGLGVGRLPRPDVATALHSRSSSFGWVGYAEVKSAKAVLFAYARDSTDGHWYPLGNSLRVTAEHVTRQ